MESKECRQLLSFLIDGDGLGHVPHVFTILSSCPPLSLSSHPSLVSHLVLALVLLLLLLLVLLLLVNVGLLSDMRMRLLNLNSSVVLILALVVAAVNLG